MTSGSPSARTTWRLPDALRGPLRAHLDALRDRYGRHGGGGPAGSASAPAWSSSIPSTRTVDFPAGSVRGTDSPRARVERANHHARSRRRRALDRRRVFQWAERVTGRWLGPAEAPLTGIADPARVSRQGQVKLTQHRGKMLWVIPRAQLVALTVLLALFSLVVLRRRPWRPSSGTVRPRPRPSRPTTPVAIPTGPAVVSSTITVSGAGPSLWDVNLTTFIAHTFARRPRHHAHVAGRHGRDAHDRQRRGQRQRLRRHVLGRPGEPGRPGAVHDERRRVDRQPVRQQRRRDPLVPEEPLQPSRARTRTARGRSSSTTTSRATAARSTAGHSSSPRSPTRPRRRRRSTRRRRRSRADGPGSRDVDHRGDRRADLSPEPRRRHEPHAHLRRRPRHHAMSPAGTVVTFTTDNGAGNDNIFNGTFWDDRQPGRRGALHRPTTASRPTTPT